MPKNGLSMIQRILSISGSLDIETMGLAPGSGIHEVAYGTFGKQGRAGDILQYIIQPSAVVGIDEEGMATPYRKPTRARPSNARLVTAQTWQEIDLLNTRLIKNKSANLDRLSSDLRSISGADLVSRVAEADLFRRDALVQGKYPWLPRFDDTSGRILEPGVRTEQDIARAVKEKARASGIRIGAIQTQISTMQEVLRGDSTLSRKMRNSVTWIANTQFESRHIGAHIDIIEKHVRDLVASGRITQEQAQNDAKYRTIRDHLAWQNPRQTGLLYSTGKEYNRALTRAKLGLSEEGYIEVWKTLLQHTEAGDVRDVFDLVRIQEEYVQRIAPGFLKNKLGISGGVELQYRLMSAMEEGAAGLAKEEVHFGALDVPVQEKIVRTLMEENLALQQVYEGTAEGTELLEEFRGGRGILSRLFARQAMAQEVGPALQRSNILNRLDKAYRDLSVQGYTEQSAGLRRIEVQAMKRGEPFVTEGIDIAIPRGAQHRFTTLDQVVEHMRGMPEAYPEELLQEEVANFRRFITGDTSAIAVTEKVKARTQSIKDTMFDFGGRGKEAFISELSTRRPSLAGIRGAPSSRPLPMATLGKIGTAGIGIGAALAMSGVIYGAMQGGTRRDEEPSLLRMNYQTWLNSQNEFYGTRGSGSYMNGMSHTGVAGGRRSTLTDFGSPYQGPMAASYVFMEQDLLAERERYLRETFGKIHSSEGIFYPMVGRTKHRFIGGGTSASGMALPGISGGGPNVMTMDLSNYKIQVDDADTITVKRGGVRGAVQSFFGFNRGYEFRLGGIDAPETFHGELGMKSAQPHADDATMALKAMLRESGNLQLVYDPENVTYGRMVGAIIADGRNVNFDLVKRGHVAALPFYKKGTTPLVDLKGVQRLEEYSRASQVGMWAHPYFQIYSSVEEITNQRITFNTFSRKSQVARNATTMSLASLMQNAQDQGFVSTADRIAASDIGLRYSKVGFGEDYRNMPMMAVQNAPHNSYIDQMARDNANLMKTRGGIKPNKFSRRGGYGELDKSLAIDSTGTTNSIWNKRKLASYQLYNVERNRRHQRREYMAAGQKAAMKNMFASPTNHHRM